MSEATKAILNSIPAEIRALNAASTAVREHAGTEQSKQVMALLEAIESLYLEQLRTVHVERLQHTQAKLAQVMELKKLFAGDGFTNGTV